LADPFDKYIFCEESEELLEALQTRTERIAPNADVHYVLGDCNEKIDKICALIPKPSSDNTVLSLCFIDPCDFGIKHETIRKLSNFAIDFLVLLAIGMDANRNYDHYVEGESHKIDDALGNTEWRERWKHVGVRRGDFRRFLAQEFAKGMETLRYLPQELHQMKEVRSAHKNLPLYHLALFSRKELAYKFWKQVLKYSTLQQGLFEE
jgi:three-Cys-motif partner protein